MDRPQANPEGYRKAWQQATKAIKKIVYQGQKYHIALGDIKRQPFGFAIDNSKMLPMPGGVAGTVELRGETLVVKGSEIKAGHIKALKNALKVAGTGLDCSDKAPMLDGSPDTDDGTAAEQQQAPLLEELNDLFERSKALAQPLPPAPFQVIRKLILSAHPELAKAKAQIVALRNKIDQLETAGTASTSRKDMNAAIKARAERSKVETATQAARAQRLIEDWKKIEPNIKTHILSIAKARGADPRILAKKAKAIKAAIEAKEYDKLSDVTFFLNGMAFGESSIREAS